MVNDVQDEEDKVMNKISHKDILVNNHLHLKEKNEKLDIYKKIICFNNIYICIYL